MSKRCCRCKNAMEPDAPPTRRYCLPCWRARAATYVAANAEKVKATQKAYRERVKAGVPSRPNSRGRSTLCYRCRVDMGPNKPRGSGYCKPCAAEMARESRARHPEGAAAAQARWETKHPNRKRELRKIRHADGGLGRQRAYYAENRDRIKAYWYTWCAANKPKVSLFNQRARARRLGAVGSHTIAEWKSVLRHFKRRCAYCNTKLTAANISKDHVVPLSRGGTDSILNIVPACRSCNSRKHNRDVAEFVAHL